MKYKIVLHTLGEILLVEAGLLLFPLITALIYREFDLILPFAIPILLTLVIGVLLVYFTKNNDHMIFAKEGFAITGLGWIIISLFGSLPFLISGEIPNFFDAFFETVSGFTTTGSSILNNIEGMSYGLLFWRSFTHWIGGMGILVFVLALLPNINTRSMFILKAESPGPQVGKLVSKLRFTARILYAIYIGLTIVQIILLLVGGMPLFDSIVHSFGTAGTGGFGIKNTSIAYYDNVYFEVVITVFMLIFGTNFNIFYLILIGQARNAIKNEELRYYIGIVLVSITVITINTIQVFGSIGEALRHSSFQVASIITTTGFASTDFNLWPETSKWVLIILMLTGACAGSTGGGIKISRVVILCKTIFNEIKNSLHPHQVLTLNFEGRKVDTGIVRGVSTFLITHFFIIILGTLIISFDGDDLLTSLTTVMTSISNVGPGLNAVGPMGNFSFYSNFSKLFLSFVMLAGRLEIFPILMLFTPRMWKSQ